MNKWILLLGFLTCATANAYQTVYNPFTGKLDYVGVSSSSLSGNFIQNSDTLQAGTTFYVSSGTVNTLSVSSFTLTGPAYYDKSGDYLYFNTGTAFPASMSFGPANGTPSTIGIGTVNFGIANMGTSGASSQFNNVFGLGNFSNNTSSSNNFVMGLFNMVAAQTANQTFAMGDHILQNNATSPQADTMLGSSVATYLSIANDDTFIGYASEGNVNGSLSIQNNCIGFECDYYVTSNLFNTFDGPFAALYNTTGDYNTCMGYQCAHGGSGATALVSGNYDTMIGANTTMGGTGAYSVSIALGYGANITGNNQAIIGGVAGSGNEVTLYVDSATVQGGFLGLTSYTAAQILQETPSAVGQMYYCSNCTNTTVCVSTGTALAAFSRIQSPTGVCN